MNLCAWYASRDLDFGASVFFVNITEVYPMNLLPFIFYCLLN